MTMEDQKVTMCPFLKRGELLGWASDSLAFYGLDLSRISTLFLSQAYWSEVNRVFNTFDLTSPIKVLEGHRESDSTPPADQFKHAPLTGLYKKHFTSPRFLGRNLANFAGSKSGQKHFARLWNEAVQVSASDETSEKAIGYLVHQMIVPPVQMKNASSTMTGEWIVFHVHEGRNYYLTLAFHSESNEEIHRKVIHACISESWPFAFLAASP